MGKQFQCILKVSYKPKGLYLLKWSLSARYNKLLKNIPGLDVEDMSTEEDFVEIAA